MKTARIIFNDSTVFKGELFSDGNDCIGEMVFNTAMTGYQEILTDPSYAGQFVVMTYPMIGNYGINDTDIESRHIFLDALIVRDYVDTPSNWQSKKTLKAYLESKNTIGLTEVDTRALTKYIRETGAKRALITKSDKPIDTLLKETDLSSGMNGTDLAKFVTCENPYTWHKPQHTKYKVAVIDCGIKYNILEMLKARGCHCDVYPIRTSAEKILNAHYDGVFISNGPGDPAPTKAAISLIQDLFGKIPLYGICLGQQLICLALGVPTFKMKFGHHGANHPVLNVQTGRVEISSQNHGFGVEKDSLEKAGFEVTYINLNDNTVAGVRHKNGLTAAVQFHPEASPGPHDSRHFFDEFITLMNRFKATNIPNPSSNPTKK